jgi:hypothetical protein
MMRKQVVAFSLFLAAAHAAAPAYAYMGPGAGLGMLGSVLAVAGAVLIAVFGIVLLPLRMLLRRRRKAQTQP